MTNPILVLLCGLPGAGKSLFASELQKLYEGGGDRLSFDEKQVVSEDWNETTFRESRDRALAALKELLAANVCSSTSSSSSSSSPTHRQKRHLIIVDDIMYLTSMRREVYSIARQLLIPTVVVWISVELQLAIDRNGQRVAAAKVSEEAIKKIHSRFEAPNSSNAAERISFIVDANGTISSIQEQARYILDKLEDSVASREQSLARQREDSLRVEAAVAFSSSSIATDSHDEGYIHDKVTNSTTSLYASAIENIGAAFHEQQQQQQQQKQRQQTFLHALDIALRDVSVHCLKKGREKVIL